MRFERLLGWDVLVRKRLPWQGLSRLDELEFGLQALDLEGEGILSKGTLKPKSNKPLKHLNIPINPESLGEEAKGNIADAALCAPLGDA